MDINEFVPMAQWGRDHWSTFAYLETVVVDKGLFYVELNPRMRSSRRTHRVLAESKGSLSAERQAGFDRCVTLARGEGSELADGTTIIGHDDWACVQDFANLGLLTHVQGGCVATPEVVEPEAALGLTPVGLALAAELRAHKAGGGSFKNFKPKEFYHADTGGVG